MKKIAISQSNYIPWKGYFDNIAAVDTFVLFDDVQFTKRDWRNRNLIKTSQGDHWLTIPVEVKGKFNQQIRETKIASADWASKHLALLLQHYSKAPCFFEVKDWVTALYQSANFKCLSEVNYHFIKEINKFLGIETEILWSHDFEKVDGQNERLISICKQLQGNYYYSGTAAKTYLDEAKFNQQKLEVKWFNNEGYQEYPQLHGKFNHFVTIFDLIFHKGSKSKEYLKFANNG